MTKYGIKSLNNVLRDDIKIAATIHLSFQRNIKSFASGKVTLNKQVKKVALSSITSWSSQPTGSGLVMLHFLQVWV